MTISVIGLGAGGHAKVLVEVLQARSDIYLVGLLDRDIDNVGVSILGVPIIGDDTFLPELRSKGVTHFFIGLGSIGNTKPRQRLYDLACANGLVPVDTIHSTAYIAHSAQVARGVSALARCLVNTNAIIGENVIINSGAIIEHDCRIADHVHIATGATLAGTVFVQEGAHIGAGAVIRQGITIGKHAIVGMGAVVVSDVPEGVTVVGVPARVLNKDRA